MYDYEITLFGSNQTVITYTGTFECAERDANKLCTNPVLNTYANAMQLLHVWKDNDGNEVQAIRKIPYIR